MKASIPLEDLLEFKGKAAPEIARRMQARDPMLKKPLKEIAVEGMDFYEDRFEKDGPSALERLAFLLVEIGNYHAAIRDPSAIKYYYGAWKFFTAPQNRGHDAKGDQLAKEIPELRAFAEVSERYG